MADENRFFRFLWRANAVLLFVAGLCGVLFLSAAFVRTQLSSMYSEQPTTPDNVLIGKPTPETEASFELSPSGAAFKGTSTLLYELDRYAGPHHREFETGTPDVNPYGLADVRVGSGQYQYTVNLLEMDSTNAKTHWLFRGTNQIIWRQEYLTKGDPQNSVFVADVIKASAAGLDQDHNFNPYGPDKLYHYRPADGAPVQFFQAEEIRSVDQLDPDRFVVNYKANGSIGLAIFSSIDFHLISASKVGPVGK